MRCDSHIDISVRAKVSRDGGSKLDEQEDTVSAGDLVEPLTVHVGIIYLGWVTGIEPAASGATVRRSNR